MSTVDVCSKSSEGKTTLTVNQVNWFNACSCELHFLVFYPEMSGDGLKALLQTAGGEELFVRREH